MKFTFAFFLFVAIAERIAALTSVGDDEDNILLGGDGYDVLKGRGGKDTLEGGASGDYLNGGVSDDKILGQDGADKAYGVAGSDWILGGKGSDREHGGGKADYVAGGPSADALWGDNGDDELHGDGGVDEAHGDNGDDTVFGGPSGDFLYGDASDDVLNGGDGADALDGGFGDDLLIAGPPAVAEADSAYPDERFMPGPGEDTIVCGLPGKGPDNVFYTESDIYVKAKTGLVDVVKQFSASDPDTVTIRMEDFLPLTPIRFSGDGEFLMVRWMASLPAVPLIRFVGNDAQALLDADAIVFA